MLCMYMYMYIVPAHYIIHVCFSHIHTYHCWGIDFSGHLDICKLCLSGYFVRSETFPQAHIVAHAYIAVLWGMGVSIYETRHQKLAGRRKEGGGRGEGGGRREEGGGGREG